MPDEIGVHLLGRIPSPLDDHDYKLADYLPKKDVDPLDAALAAFLKKRYSQAAKDLAIAVVQRIQDLSPIPAPTPPPPSPSPTPPPPPPVGVVGWLDADDPILDQGNTGHCVGFTGADWENALPVDDHVQNAAGEDLYYACKVVDGEPGQENGSYVRSLMKVLKARGRLTAYAAANTIDEVWAFVANHGPVCWGIGWTNSMFKPDATGLVVPVGPDVGGHAIIQYGVDGEFGLMLNHWGPDWGVGGHFRMHKSDLAERLANQGEAWAAVEIP